MRKIMWEQFKQKSDNLRRILERARRITICLDGWSKSSLTESFIGLSACFFDPATNKPIHAFLALSQLPHPHTGERLAQCIDACLSKWNISPEKVLLVVSDNGANMVKAIRVIRENHKVKICLYTHCSLCFYVHLLN
jgi:hypothetical protein